MAKVSYAQRIKGRIQQLEALIAEANAELVDLRVASRVLERLGYEEEVKGPDDGQFGTPITKDSTVAEMAIRCLEENGPMDTPAILAKLQQTWRPDLKQTTLASTLSRVKAEGRIYAEFGKWNTAVKTEEPPEGGSQEIGVVADTTPSINDVFN